MSLLLLPRLVDAVRFDEQHDRDHDDDDHNENELDSGLCLRVLAIELQSTGRKGAAVEEHADHALDD